MFNKFSIISHTIFYSTELKNIAKIIPNFNIQKVCYISKNSMYIMCGNINENIEQQNNIFITILVQYSILHCNPNQLCTIISMKTSHNIIKLVLYILKMMIIY